MQKSSRLEFWSLFDLQPNTIFPRFWGLHQSLSDEQGGRSVHLPPVHAKACWALVGMLGNNTANVTITITLISQPQPYNSCEHEHKKYIHRIHFSLKPTLTQVEGGGGSMQLSPGHPNQCGKGKRFRFPRNMHLGLGLFLQMNFLR